MLLVTMHKFPGGVHTAVDIRDGCFGTTTVMRIASMFVPSNIFQVLLHAEHTACNNRDLPLTLCTSSVQIAHVSHIL